jgi:hypothetical protein
VRQSKDLTIGSFAGWIRQQDNTNDSPLTKQPPQITVDEGPATAQLPGLTADDDTFQGIIHHLETPGLQCCQGVALILGQRQQHLGQIASSLFRLFVTKVLDSVMFILEKITPPPR